MLGSAIIIVDYLSYYLQQAVAASQASCWSKQSRRENDEDADSHDDKDGHSDIPQFPSRILMQVGDHLGTIRSHLSSSKATCNDAFRFPSTTI